MRLRTKPVIFLLVLGIVLGLGLLLLPSEVQAHAPEAETKIIVYFFWGDGCPHCAAEKPFLEEMKKKYPQLEVRAFEVWYNSTNQALMEKMCTAYGFDPKAVPTTFIGKKYWIGFTDTYKKEIETAIAACTTTTCTDAGAGIIPGVAVPVTQPPTPATSTNQVSETDDYFDIPFVGTIDLKAQPLIVSTLLISFIDGFNPCSIWVLTMLLALTLHTGSRKKIAIIGLVFLTVTAGVYALFILGLFSLFTVVSFVGWVQVLVSIVAFFFALVNIKDYFFYKEGVSFTISDKDKPGIFSKIRRVLDASDNFWSMVGATVVLAAGVSLVEFSCTAGFPVLWTNLLASQQVTGVTFVLLLIVYLIIYQLDELVIFFSAVYTLKAQKLEEKYGRMMKLIGGTLMLTLAIVMLIDPSIMSSISSSLIVFAAAFAVAFLILWLHRKVLPHYGIWIGTEEKKSRRLKVRRAK
jgi:thiol-disulfide isomerase/thioredoxin